MVRPYGRKVEKMTIFWGIIGTTVAEQEDVKKSVKPVNTKPVQMLCIDVFEKKTNHSQKIGKLIGQIRRNFPGKGRFENFHFFLKPTYLPLLICRFASQISLHPNV